MEFQAPFKRCPVCNAKYPLSDVHPVCNRCLSPDHDEESCLACSKFRSEEALALRREARLPARRASDVEDIFEAGDDEGVQEEEPEHFSDPASCQESYYGEEVDDENIEDDEAVEVRDNSMAIGAAEGGSSDEQDPTEPSGVDSDTVLSKAQVEASPEGLSQDLYTHSTAPQSGPAKNISEPSVGTPSKTKTKLTKDKSKLKLVKPVFVSQSLVPSDPKKARSVIAPSGSQKGANPKIGTSKKVPKAQRDGATSSKAALGGVDTEDGLESQPPLSPNAYKLMLVKVLEDKHKMAALERDASSRGHFGNPSATPGSKLAMAVKKVKQPSGPPPIVFGLPPTARPKTSKPAQGTDPGKMMSKLKGTTAAPEGVGSTPPSSESSKKLYIDSATGRLTLFKRKILPEKPMESYQIPLKRKRDSASSPVLFESVRPYGQAFTHSTTRTEDGGGMTKMTSNSTILMNLIRMTRRMCSTIKAQRTPSLTK